MSAPAPSNLAKRPDNWLELCAFWKKEYPVITQKHREDTRQTNVYAFMESVADAAREGQTIVVGNGSACVVGSHGFHIKKNQRFIINSAIASMGYDLPAATGAAIAENNDEIILLTGDGSIQMNLQELQTILTNGLNIKIFIINNDGYHSIRQTQTNLFDGHFVGIGPESGGISFPDMSRIAAAYGYPYYSCRSNSQLTDAIGQTMAEKGAAICEVFCSSKQFFEPKSGTRKLEDGSLYSPPLYDLKPFLPREELRSNIVEGYAE
jgi:acetolactate synthase-1/2/3 large subunit